ncbi:MAG: Gfo/Idh/MocA family oxidoreductase [Verrucomicrobiota bacterium]|nr:Gfo/Idh/MocA family oxidoreductase [Verrucomicrobiota bacterium]
MNICIIGSSGHYSYVTQGIRDNKELKLVGVAPGSDVDSAEDLKRIADEFGCKPYDSYAEMLDIEKPDVAGISSRYDLNADISIDCLNRGIHCMTEKTIAHSYEKLDAIRKAAENSGKTIIAMHAMRYTPEFYAAYKALEKGAIGEPRLITGQKSYGFNSARPEFYKARDTYGGTILWVASHAIDWAYWMMGEFKTIYALHSAKNNLNYGTCEMVAAIAFSFPNGAIGTINSDFYQPKKSKTPGDQIRIAGDKGIIQVRNNKAFLTTDDQEKIELPLETGDFFGDFCRELQGNGKCRLSMLDTFNVTNLCLRARESADLGGKVFNIKTKRGD